MKVRDWARRKTPAVALYIKCQSFDASGEKQLSGSAHVRCDEALVKVVTGDLDAEDGGLVGLTEEAVRAAFLGIPAKQVFALVEWMLKELETNQERQGWLWQRAEERRGG